MNNFISSSIKAVATTIAEISKVLFSFNHKKIKKINKTKSTNYGGFTSKDWEKVGTDMKRGLITFGKTR